MTTYDGIESCITTIKKMALQGDAESQYKLGFCYKEGIGTPQNYKEAVKWLKIAAEAGYALAQGDLSHCLFYGFGVVEDKELKFRK